ncbi:MAG: DUF3343 domain-containing protein [Tissierellia bacterium]|nr:DUF3343 domain-containing protein [Tissierellia bacterium]
MSSSHAKYFLFAFDNSQRATLAYDLVKDFKQSRLIPLPPEIDAGCGLSLRILYEDLDKSLNLFDENNIKFDGIYTFDHENFKRKIEKYVL